MERAEASYTNEDSGKFRLTSTSKFNKQFANLYFTRLGQLGPAAKASARALWGDIAYVKTLDVDAGAAVIVVGTLYKEMSAKPSIIKDGADTFQSTAVHGGRQLPDKYCGDDDVLSLEDESGRLAITGAVLQDFVLVTGAVVAVRGQLSADGVLQVDGVCYPGMAPQRALPDASGPEDSYVALVSGLHMGRSEHDMLPIMLLTEYLTGQLGGLDDHRLQASIVRLVIAGNTLCDPGNEASSVGVDALKKMSTTDQRGLASCIGSLDAFITAVSAAMPVDLMPGSDDPCNFLLPQQPFHQCLLTQASRLSTLTLCTNPHNFSVSGVNFLGSAGQPLDDMQRYLPGDDRLHTLSEALRMRHIVPTAPDTVGCFPFTDEDPFVLEESPHVFFAGNQPRFEDTIVRGPDGQATRTILVPDFARERTCVLVNLRTLECRPISFGNSV